MKKLVIFLAGFFLLCSCTPSASTSATGESVKLINGFKSYQTIEQARQYLSSLGLKWVVFEDAHLPPGDKRPPFDMYTIEVNGFIHLDQSGVLQLTFFNNRLLTTVFYPDHFSQYLQALLQKENIDLINSKRQLINKARVWKHEDYRGKLYVGWKDTRLEREEFEWIKKYS